MLKLRTSIPAVAALALCAGAFFCPANAKDDSITAKAAENVLSSMQNYFDDVAELKDMSPDAKVDYVLTKAEDRVKEKIADDAQDAMKEAILDYAKTSLRAKAFHDIALPKIIDAAILQKGFDWASLDNAMNSDVDTKMNAIKMGITSAKMAWSTYKAYSDGGVMAGIQTLSGAVCNALADAYIPGWGYFKAAADLTMALGNYVLSYANDTAYDSMFNILYPEAKTDPGAFANWLIGKSPSALTQDIETRWNDTNVEYYSKLWYGNCTEKGNDAMKKRIKDELNSMRGELVVEKKEREDKLNQYTSLLKDAKAAEQNVNGLAKKVTSDTDAALAQINDFKSKLNDYRKQDKDQQQGSVQPVLSGPDTADNAAVNNYTVDFGTNTQAAADSTFLWHASNIQGNASGQSVNVLFDKTGDISVSVDVSNSKNLFTPVTLSKKVTVTPAAPASAASAASLSLLSQNCWPGQPEDITVTVAGLSKSTYSAVGLIVAEKTSNTLLTAPDPFVPPGSADVKDGPHTLKYTAPQTAGNYTITLEAHGKTADGKEVVLGKDQKNFMVGTAAISAPDQAKPGDIIQASLTASDVLFQNVKSVAWDGGAGKVKSHDSSGKSATILMASVNTAITATVVLSGGKYFVIEKDVACNIPGAVVAPVVPAGWTRAYPYANRAEDDLIIDINGDRGARAKLTASINFWSKDIDNMTKDAWKRYREAYAGGNAKATTFTNDRATNGPMKGVIYESDITVRNESSQYIDVYGGGGGYCYNDSFDGPVGHVFSYNITGEGGAEYLSWLKDEVARITSEIKVIIPVETFHGDKTNYNSAKPAVPPVVTLTADKQKLRRGDSATLTVTVKPVPDGESPLTYTWNGNVAPSNDTATFLASVSGKQTVKVTVNGKKTAALGTASIDINVGDFSVALSKLSPVKGDIPVGMPAKFSAVVLDGGKAPDPAPTLRWQPNSDVKFDPAEGTATQVSATFSKPGKASVWVEVLENDGGVMRTIGTSDNMELDIILPDIKVTPSADKPMVGDQITLQAASNPPIADIDYRWDIPKNATLVQQSKDASSVTVCLTDNKEAVITANARVPVTGESLGSGQCKLTAAEYEVTVNILGPIGPRPMTWVEGQGLVEDKKGIATGQNVNIKAVINPQPPKTPRWKWKLDEDSTIVSGGTSQQLTANRGSKGECTAEVEVISADGISLGKGNGSFNVTESQNDIAVSKKKSDAHDKLAQAKAMIPLGKLDEAITLCDAAAAEEPDLQEAKDLSTKTKADRAKISSSIDVMHKNILLKKYDDASTSWNSANTINAKYAPVIAAKKDLDDALKFAVKEKKDADDAAKKKEDQAAKDKTDKEKAEKDKADKTKTANVPSKDSGATGKGPGGSAATAAIGGTKTGSGTGAILLSEDDQAAKKKVEEAKKVESQKQSINTSADKLVNDFNNAVAKSGDGYRDTSKLEQAVAKYQQSQALKQDDNTAKKLADAQKVLAGRKDYISGVIKYESLQSDAKTLADKKDYKGAVKKALEAVKAYRGNKYDITTMRTFDNQIYNYQLADGNMIRAEGDKALKENDIQGAIATYEKAYASYPPTYPFFMNFSVQIGDLKNRVTVGKQWLKTGQTDEKKGKLQPAVDDYGKSVAQLPDADLSAHIEELKAQIAEKQAPATGSGQPADAEAVKQFYTDFTKAYESKNESRVMSMVSPDWTAGDGTSCSDLRDTLHTSFSMFDEIHYAVSGLTVQPSKGGACTASYKVKITGKIYESGITHEEESSVTEQVGKDERGKLRIIKTGEGNFWHIE